jgi:eukaryotic-like serine/threonine-protein kinase
MQAHDLSDAGPPPGPCLSEDDVLGLSDGSLVSLSLRRIEDHLDLCVHCQELVASVVTPSEVIVTLPGQEAAAPCRLALGQLISERYRIEGFLARGGMGEVYVAHDRVLGRQVALKLSRRRGGTKGKAYRQMKREFELGQRVQHANVCKVHDLGLHSDDKAGGTWPLLTMDLIEGERLSLLLRRRKLALVDVTRIARQLLLGLTALHDASVIHLDFKSDNVVLTGDAAIIVDLGLARSADAGADSGQRPIAGTVAYMAPDLALGLRPTPQADVYSFGVVLFEMLTGQLPFEADVRSSCRSVAARLTERPPPPSSLEGRVSGELDRFVLRCLAGQRSERYHDAQCALHDFDQLNRRAG